MFNMTFPTFVLGSIVAWLIGALVHLIAGGKFLRLVFCLIFSWIGFWGGNYLGNDLGLNILHYGQINYGPALLLSVIAALFGFWLSGENRDEDE
jgi:hypothetical protein